MKQGDFWGIPERYTWYFLFTVLGDQMRQSTKKIVIYFK